MHGKNPGRPHSPLKDHEFRKRKKSTYKLQRERKYSNMGEGDKERSRYVNEEPPKNDDKLSIAQERKPIDLNLLEQVVEDEEWLWFNGARFSNGNYSGTEQGFTPGEVIMMSKEVLGIVDYCINNIKEKRHILVQYRGTSAYVVISDNTVSLPKDISGKAIITNDFDLIEGGTPKLYEV